ncbi:MAG TPA: hypothetical protein VGO86_07990, partial [Candidatus Dormibacteraeota bacterium]
MKGRHVLTALCLVLGPAALLGGLTLGPGLHRNVSVGAATPENAGTQPTQPAASPSLAPAATPTPTDPPTPAPTPTP